MFRLCLALCLTAVLAGCSAVPIHKADPDDLEVTLDYRHQPHQVEVRTEMRTGIWKRRVDAGGNLPEVITSGGEVRTLKEGVRKGEYGIQLEPELGPYLLVLPDIAEMELPLGEPVQLTGQAEVADQLFNRDDELTLAISGTTERERGWSFTAYCGDESWTLNLSLDRDDTEIRVPLATLMRQINAAAEADLAGQIPVTVTLWEDYDPAWSAPFKPGMARAEDQVSFKVDTAGFRFQAKLNVQVANNLFLGLQKEAWPVRHCH